MRIAYPYQGNQVSHRMRSGSGGGRYIYELTNGMKKYCDVQIIKTKGASTPSHIINNLKSSYIFQMCP